MIVKLLRSRGTGSLEGNSQIVDTYVVVSNGPISVPAAAAAPGVTLGSQHPDAPALYASEIQPQLVEHTSEGKQIWHVDIVYKLPRPETTGGHGSSQPGGGNYGGTSANPIDWPMELTISARKEERVLHKDYSNPPKPITNSAGAPYDPPIMAPVAIAVIRFTKYYPPNFNALGKLMTVINKVNSQAWQGFPARTLLVTDMRASFEKVNNFWVWKVEYQLDYKQDMWNPLLVLDHGHYYLDAQGRKVLAKDASGAPLAEGILLDGTGKPLPQGLQPVYRSFIVYEEIDFNFHIP